jgi:hypothetical protein
MRTTAAPYTESRLAYFVQNKFVGFPVVEHEERALKQSFMKHPCMAKCEATNRTVIMDEA